MEMEWYRDLAIFVFCTLFSVVLIMLGVFSAILMAKIKSILNSVKAAAASGRRIMETFEVELKRPLLQLVTMVQAIYQAVQSISVMMKKKPTD
jgi:hypothetical protein